MVYSQRELFICLLFLCFVTVCCTKHSDKNRCRKVVSWELQKVPVTINATGVLTRGDEKSKIVETEIVRDGYVNVTTSVLECCTGFFENDNGKCKIFDVFLECPHGRFGHNCENHCKCDGYKRCNHVTGECRKCVLKPCEDDEAASTSTSTTSTMPPSRTYSPASKSSYYTTMTTPTNITSAGNTIQGTNCTGEACDGLTASRGSDEDDKSNNDDTILIAVIMSLGAVTIVLLVGIVLRERYRKIRKRRKKRTGEIDENPQYVDAEPVYFEIKDEDINCNGKAPFVQIPEPVRKKNTYQPCGRESESDHQDGEIDEDECGYLNPYTPLRFARSETNLYKDRKIQENGEYSVAYSVPKGENGPRNDTKKAEESNFEDPSSQKNAPPVYFILEKLENDSESHEGERNKLLSESSRSSI